MPESLNGTSYIPVWRLTGPRFLSTDTPSTKSSQQIRLILRLGDEEQVCILMHTGGSTNYNATPADVNSKSRLCNDFVIMCITMQYGRESPFFWCANNCSFFQLRLIRCPTSREQAPAFLLISGATSLADHVLVFLGRELKCVMQYPSRNAVTGIVYPSQSLSSCAARNTLAKSSWSLRRP